MLFPLIFGIEKVVGCENSTLRTVIIGILPILVVPEIMGSNTLILTTLIIKSKGFPCSTSIFNLMVFVFYTEGVLSLQGQDESQIRIQHNRCFTFLLIRDAL